MSEIKAGLRIDMGGNLKDQAKANADAMDRFAKRTKGDLDLIDREATESGKSLSDLGRNVSGLIAGYVGLRAMQEASKRFIDTESRYEQLGVNGRMSKEEVAKLREDLLETATAPDIKVPEEKLLSSVEAVIEKLGDAEFAKAQMPNMGMAIQGTGAEGEAVGGMLSAGTKFGLKTAEEMAGFLSMAIEQGKEKAFPLAKLASLGERVFSAAAGAGLRGMKGAADTGALLQVGMEGTGNPELAATAFTNVITDLTKGENAKRFRKLGVEVYQDKEKTKLRSPADILMETINATGGNLQKLNEIFGEQSRAIINQLNIERQAGYPTLTKLRAMRGSVELLANDSARMAQTTRASADNARTGYNRASEMVVETATKGTVALADFGTGLVTDPRVRAAVSEPTPAMWEEINRRFAEQQAAKEKAAAPAPQAVDVNIKVDQDGRVKRVEVKGAGSIPAAQNPANGSRRP